MFVWLYFASSLLEEKDRSLLDRNRDCRKILLKIFSCLIRLKDHCVTTIHLVPYVVPLKWLLYITGFCAAYSSSAESYWLSCIEFRVRGYDDTSLPEESFAYQIARMVKLFGLLNICFSAADAEESVTRSAQNTSFCTACPCLCGEQASTFISNVDTTLSKITFWNATA